MARTILIIEDDKNIADLVALHVRDQGWEPTVMRDGRRGLDAALEKQFDLIVLDLMLPQVNGIEVCKSLRARDVHTPILMLTARSEEVDRILGLEFGADDYITKPFSIRELIARMKAVFRRLEMGGIVDAPPGKDVAIGALRLDPARRKVTLNGEKLDLTAKEYELLLLFCTNPGRTYTREQLLNLVWGYQFQGYEHTVNSHINRLRAKIEADPSQPRYVLTVWGVGYRFTEAEELES
jgi:DNA-binding response OmpR family regulator